MRLAILILTSIVSLSIGAIGHSLFIRLSTVKDGNIEWLPAKTGDIVMLGHELTYRLNENDADRRAWCEVYLQNQSDSKIRDNVRLFVRPNFNKINIGLMEAFYEQFPDFENDESNELKRKLAAFYRAKKAGLKPDIDPNLEEPRDNDSQTEFVVPVMVELEPGEGKHYNVPLSIPNKTMQHELAVAVEAS